MRVMSSVEVLACVAGVFGLGEQNLTSAAAARRRQGEVADVLFVLSTFTVRAVKLENRVSGTWEWIACIAVGHPFGTVIATVCSTHSGHAELGCGTAQTA